MITGNLPPILFNPSSRDFSFETIDVLGVGILFLSKDKNADILLSHVNIPSLLLIINEPDFSKDVSSASPISSSKTPARTKHTVFLVLNFTSLSLPSKLDTVIIPVSKSLAAIHASLTLMM